MSDQRPGILSPREIQQLQLSLKSGSVREVALTVCTIRGLAIEVKSILRDLFYDEVPAPLPSQRPRDNSFGVLPMAPPDPFQQLSALNTMNQVSSHPYSMIQKTSGFSRLMAKRGIRRHRCSHCPRTFSAKASVWRHVKTHHSGDNGHSDHLATSMRAESAAVASPSKNPCDIDQLLSIDLTSNQPTDTSVATPMHTSGASDENTSVASPMPSSVSQPASSPEDHMSPMPTVADMFNADSIKPEPSNEYVGKSELDADMEVVSPMKSHYAEGDASMSPSIAASMSALFPSPNTMSNNNESQIRAAIDAQLMEPPIDGMYQCSDCGWRSKSSSSMRSHMLSHKGILPFSCNICNYKTNKKHVLTRHYTVHTGEKPHKCPICTFGSLDHVELLKHMTKTHPGVHPYTCTICGHHATTTTLLKKHMKSDHSVSTPRQSPGSARAQSSDAASSTPMPSLTKNMKPHNVLSSSSETIFANSSFNQPVFP